MYTVLYKKEQRTMEYINKRKTTLGNWISFCSCIYLLYFKQFTALKSVEDIPCGRSLNLS